MFCSSRRTHNGKASSKRCVCLAGTNSSSHDVTAARRRSVAAELSAFDSCINVAVPTRVWFGGSVPNSSDDVRVKPPSTPAVNDDAKDQSPPAVRRNRKRRLAWSEGNFATICRRYFRTRACKYGESCRYDHHPNSTFLAKVASVAESRDSSDSDSPAGTVAASEDGTFAVEATLLIPPFPCSGGEQNLFVYLYIYIYIHVHKISIYFLQIYE